MKALQFDRPGDDDVVSIAEIAIPQPGPGEISIDVAYCGLNFADALARKGVAGYASRWPFVPGLEVSGNVRAVGPDVDGFAVGASVLAMTVDGFGCAEVAIAKAALCTLADGTLDQMSLATVPLTWATAYALVERSGADASSRVLVTSAAGGVGSALATLLRRKGVQRLVGAVGSAAKVRCLNSVLCDDVLPRDDDFADALGDGPANARFSTVLESVGGVVFDAALRALAPTGRIVSYGVASGADYALPELGFFRRSNLSLFGFSIIGLARTDPEAVSGFMRRILDDHWPEISSLRPMVTPLVDAAEAHLLQSRGHSSGKTVVALR